MFKGPKAHISKFLGIKKSFFNKKQYMLAEKALTKISIFFFFWMAARKKAHKTDWITKYDVQDLMCEMIWKFKLKAT